MVMLGSKSQPHLPCKDYAKIIYSIYILWSMCVCVGVLSDLI